MDAELVPQLAAGGVTVFFDPPAHHQMRNRLFDRESNPYAGDNILAPYVSIHDRLTQAGISVQTADMLPERPDGRRNIIISFGTPDRLASHFVRKYIGLGRRPDVVLSAFFAMECPVVEPTLFEWLPVLQRHFRRIMSWSDTELLLPFTHVPIPIEHFCRPWRRRVACAVPARTALPWLRSWSRDSEASSQTSPGQRRATWRGGSRAARWPC